MPGTVVPLGPDSSSEGTPAGKSLAAAIDKLTDAAEQKPEGSDALAEKLGALTPEQVEELDQPFSMQGNALTDWQWFETAEQVKQADGLLDAWLNAQDAAKKKEAGSTLAKYVSRL
ncbi:hypothetical protein CL628_02415 [bacterium]|nr:hypothetical protein [bacterium]